MVGAKPTLAPCISGSKLRASDVNQLCQHLHASTIAHWTSVKRVLGNLKVTLMIDIPLQDMAYILVHVSSLGGQRNNRWYLSQAPKLSTGLFMTVANLYRLRMLLKDLHVSISTSPII